MMKDLIDYTVTELREMLKVKGQVTSGTKAELIERLNNLTTNALNNGQENSFQTVVEYGGANGTTTSPTPRDGNLLLHGRGEIEAQRMFDIYQREKKFA